MPSDESDLHPQASSSILTHQEYTPRRKWFVKQLIIVGVVLVIVVLLGISVSKPDTRQYVLYPVIIYAGCKMIDKVLEFSDKKTKDEKEG